MVIYLVEGVLFSVLLYAGILGYLKIRQEQKHIYDQTDRNLYLIAILHYFLYILYISLKHTQIMNFILEINRFAIFIYIDYLVVCIYMENSQESNLIFASKLVFTSLFVLFDFEVHKLRLLLVLNLLITMKISYYCVKILLIIRKFKQFEKNKINNQFGKVKHKIADNEVQNRGVDISVLLVVQILQLVGQYLYQLSLKEGEVDENKMFQQFLVDFCSFGIQSAAIYYIIYFRHRHQLLDSQQDEKRNSLFQDYVQDFEMHSQAK